MSTREYLTVQEAAEYAEVSRKTVYRWIHDFYLTVYERKRGEMRRRGWLVSRAELEALCGGVEQISPAR